MANKLTTETTTGAAVANHTTENVTVTNGGQGAAPVNTATAQAGASPSVNSGGSVATATGKANAGIAAATEFEPSGAPVQTVADVDPSHPAVDANPRAGTTINQNRIDFNDPTLSGPEAVAKMLKDQSA